MSLLHILVKINVGYFSPLFSFWQLIRLLYKYQMARVVYVDCRSRLLNIQRGVCQGCLLSPLFFNIVIEMLALAVRAKSCM